VHPRGNPHYWLDPDNARRIVALFQSVFSRLDPQGAEVYAANARAYLGRLDSAETAWAPLVARVRGLPVVGWHTSWRYFAQYTGLELVGFMEPKPGVPPSPSHLAGLIQTMRRTGARAIIMEPFYNRKTADFVARQTGARVLVIPPSVDGTPAVPDYFALMGHNIAQVAELAGSGPDR
jgi:ABC-type Zn uptake system ZnuABC Zn-binding protein ZnuA